MRQRRAPQVRRHPFVVEVNGTTYKCERVVTGTRRLKQTVHASGRGSKPDAAAYGSHDHSINTMETFAKMIASEIVRGL